MGVDSEACIKCVLYIILIQKVKNLAHLNKIILVDSLTFFSITLVSSTPLRSAFDGRDHAKANTSVSTGGLNEDVTSRLRLDHLDEKTQVGSLVFMTEMKTWLNSATPWTFTSKTAKTTRQDMQECISFNVMPSSNTVYQILPSLFSASSTILLAMRSCGIKMRCRAWNFVAPFRHLL